jgi:hypothetical protein
VPPVIWLSSIEGKMKPFLAYAITFFLAPTFSAVMAIPLMPIQVKIFKSIPVINFFIGLVTAWLGTLIFSWFGLKANILMIIILSAGFILNSLREIGILPNAWMFLVAELAGVATGGYLFFMN